MWSLFTYAVVFVLFQCVVRAIVPPRRSLHHSSEHSNSDYDWSSISASKDLRWHKCYEEYQCARLTVPLDWTNSSNENEVHVALVKLPAKVGSSDPSFGGSIILNPGGPSGSGTDDIRWNGHAIQNIADGEKHFEIVSFDPRAVHRTTPTPACFDNDEARDRFNELNEIAGSPGIESSLDVKWALAQGFGLLCANATHGVYPNGDNIKQYSSTALVARDMVRIIDAIAEERDQATVTDPKTDQKHLGSSSPPLLNYWGFSYGTYLGNTFASMFPHRIGRMILDGNVDPWDYAATGWSTNLNDNNLVWRTFFEWCFDAGTACALHSQQFQSALNMHAKVIDLYESIRQDPVPYIDQEGRIHVLTYFNLEFTMHPYAYNPWHSWPRLATNIASLLSGNPLPFLNLTCPGPSDPPPDTGNTHHKGDSYPDPRFLNRTDPYPPSYPHELEAAVSILCGDGTPLTSETKSDFSSYLDHLVNQSALIGPTWAQITLPCRHWPTSLRPAERNRFTGPFGSKLADYDKGAGADGWARPLLFVGNTADPVTPLRNAKSNGETHEGSRVLTSNSPGHCSGPNQPSRCVWEEVRRFYNDGELPEEGKVCEVDWKPWDRKIGG
jgi:pimeloyl-ACP methyl ester carboxylesterase